LNSSVVNLIWVMFFGTSSFAQISALEGILIFGIIFVKFG